MMIEITIPVVIALIIGVGEWLKSLGVNPKILPLVSMGLGMVAGLFIFGGTVTEGIILGASIGLGASGFFDLSKIGK